MTRQYFYLRFEVDFIFVPYVGKVEKMIPIVRVSLKLSKERLFDGQIKLTVTNLPVLRSIKKS